MSETVLSVRGLRTHFVTPERFQQLIDQGELLEWADIHGGLHRSGTLARPVRTATASPGCTRGW